MQRIHFETEHSLFRESFRSFLQKGSHTEPGALGRSRHGRPRSLGQGRGDGFSLALG